jgi:hypothetical protein
MSYAIHLHVIPTGSILCVSAVMVLPARTEGTEGNVDAHHRGARWGAGRHGGRGREGEGPEGRRGGGGAAEGEQRAGEAH